MLTPEQRSPGRAATLPRPVKRRSAKPTATQRRSTVSSDSRSSKRLQGAPTPLLDTNRTNFHLTPNGEGKSSSGSKPHSDEWAYKWGIRREKSRLLASKLATAQDDSRYCAKLSRQLKACNEFVRSDDGHLKAHYSLCRSRWCPVCANKVRVDRQNELAGIVAVRAKVWARSKDRRKNKARLALLTLTMRNASDLSCRQSFQRLHKAWGKLTKTREWKALNDEGWSGAWCREVEYSRKNDWFHFHQHALVEVPIGWTMTDLRKELRRLWVRCGGGPNLHLRAVDNETKAILEVSKYITKDLTKSSDELAEIITAVRGARMFQVFGKAWREARREAKDLKVQLLEQAELPEEPSPINEETGEVADLPSGDYSLAELVLLARNGSWSAMHALDWFRWFVFTSGQRYYSQLVYEHLCAALAAGVRSRSTDGKGGPKSALDWV